MKSRLRRRFTGKETHLGFQIAPMIDVVFVILLYFMVAAGNAKVESQHGTRLPGCCSFPVDLIPEDISIVVSQDGNVYLNNELVGPPAQKDLAELAGGLADLKTASDSAGIPVLVTVAADENARYERVVDVLDALTRAKIHDVTFQAGANE